ncbi:MAG TPA: group II intron reverse transcriptase/maturase [Desulfomonilaceae bacterium]|nr:group II intron reverse transcriptase/maturase [Desulfomonilaceae bacterium]
MKTAHDETQPAVVSEGTTQAGEGSSKDWEWVERHVWTERMLEALAKGVKGGVWFSLIDKVQRPSTLAAAWTAVKHNGGSAGSDHQSIKDFEKDLAGEIARLSEALRIGSYRPRPIRRVYIDKPGSKEKRPLGIPCVRDRVVQGALRMVIEPIFENVFAGHSYGFRPGRGCKDALREVERLLHNGYTHVVDADIKAYFDNIPHDPLMADIGRYIADGRILELIGAFLKQEVMEDMTLWTPEKGSPQGAVISPLLANLYLHPVDVAMAAAGYEMIRYADDLVILCRSEAEARRALELLGKLTAERGLTLHPDKTRLVDVSIPGEGFEFLGYHFERSMRWPRPKSMKKLRDAVRSKTERSNGRSLAAIIEDVNRTLRGWFEYFKHSHKPTFPMVDKWVRRRLRSILRKRKGLHGISRGHDHFRWPNEFFRVHGLFSLVEAHRALLQSSMKR